MIVLVTLSRAAGSRVAVVAGRGEAAQDDSRMELATARRGR
jgi:hypothetical protein